MNIANYVSFVKSELFLVLKLVETEKRIKKFEIIHSLGLFRYISTLILPKNTVKITDITFGHGILNCKFCELKRKKSSNFCFSFLIFF